MKKKNKLPIKLNDFKEKEIDFRYQKVISFTQFQMYSQCPLKWANQYIHKLTKTKPSIHMTYGTSIHETVQLYIKTLYEQSGAAADRLNLEEIFQEKFVDIYQKSYESNGNIHFSTPEEMREFFDDGVVTLNWLRKNRTKYFSTKNTYLVGIEMSAQKEMKNNIVFNGYIDLVLYEANINKIKIYDIKTATKKWNEFSKKDETKLSQIILYKKHFSEIYGFPVENINVEFFILPRKVEPNEFQEYPKRVQTFSPSSGKIKIREVTEKFNQFLEDCFDSDGKPIQKEYIKQESALCPFCPFYEDRKACGVGLK